MAYTEKEIYPIKPTYVFSGLILSDQVSEDIRSNIFAKFKRTFLHISSSYMLVGVLSSCILLSKTNSYMVTYYYQRY